MSFFSVHSPRGDVEDLMARVAQKLHQREKLGDIGAEDTALFPAANAIGDIETEFMTLITGWSINGSEIVHSTRRGLAPLIIRFQRLIRKVTWWYLNPIIDQIIAFNGNSVRVLTALRAEQDLITDKVNDAHERLDLLAPYKSGAPAGGETPNNGTSGNSRILPDGAEAFASKQGLADEITEIRESMVRLAKRLDALERKRCVGKAARE